MNYLWRLSVDNCFSLIIIAFNEFQVGQSLAFTFTYFPPLLSTIFFLALSICWSKRAFSSSHFWLIFLVSSRMLFKPYFAVSSGTIVRNSWRKKTEKKDLRIYASLYYYLCTLKHAASSFFTFEFLIIF